MLFITVLQLLVTLQRAGRTETSSQGTEIILLRNTRFQYGNIGSEITKLI